MDVQEIKDWMAAHRQGMIDDLAGYVAIPSISEDKQKVGEALEYILDLARIMGFKAESLLDGRIGLIEMEPEKAEAQDGTGAFEAGAIADEVVGILSHVDVVPPGDLAIWNTPPFTLTEKDGRLYGRGTLDDKGAAIASLYAMKCLLDCGEPIYKKVQLILGTQEEVEWSDMDAYVAAYPLPDYGFTPDGEFPLCNIEKGGLDVVMEYPLDGLCTAADGWYLTALDAGTASNAVPGKCLAKLTRCENGKAAEEKTIETAGKSVHSCQPDQGINALFLMAEKLKALPEGEQPKENKLLSLLLMLRDGFADVTGKSIGLASGSEYYQGEFVHHNVFSPTLIHTAGGKLQVNLNVRFPFGTDDEALTQALIELTEKHGGRVTNVISMPAVYVSKERPFLQAFAKSYEEGCGLKNEFVLEYGGTYAKAIPGVVSWGPIFPGEEDTCHQENEYIATESLIRCGVIFAGALAKVVLSPESFK